MKKIIVLFILLSGLTIHAQDLDFVKYVVDTLCSPSMHGRGYVQKGDKTAAEFIETEFSRNGIKAFEEGYLQSFEMSINTFPKKLTLMLDGKELEPGSEYMVYCSSPKVKGTFDLCWLPEDDPLSLIESQDFSDCFLVISREHEKELAANPFGAAGIIFLDENPLWWHVSNGRKVNDFVTIKAKKEVFPENASLIEVNIKNKYYKKYKTQNVIGYVEGKTNPEQFIVFGAHYDHLGRMGTETYFPGAHDNASGTAMVMDLARYYAKPENQPDCSMAFILFSGEEAGLLGSEYFTNHPFFPLEDILFMINLDLVSTGVDGIMVVNGKVFEDAFNLMVKINDEHALLKEVKARGSARNSDHYYFYDHGVPSFFIYTLGDYPYYHRPDDLPENLPFTEYRDLFVLLTKFATSINN